MAGSLNKVLLIGNLGKDPETTHFEGGGIKVKFSLATSETYTNRNNEKVAQTEWHNIVVSRKGLAEVCEKYLKKGHKVFLEGRIRSRQWTDDSNQTRYISEITVDNMTMLTARADGNSNFERQNEGSGYNQPPQINQNMAPKQHEDNDINLSDQDDDLPF